MEEKKYTGDGLDESPSEFADRIMKTINSGSLALAISLGVDNGLFDVLVEQKGPKTSQEIAKIAGLKERYVREWLGAMVVGSIVEMDPETKEYHIPERRKPFLKKGPYNIVAFSGLVPLLSQAYNQVSDCFKENGPEGVPYSQYPRFQSFMDHMSRVMHDRNLLKNIITAFDGLTEMLDAGIDVLDVGCGRGHVSILLAQRFPQSRFHGIDISEDGIAFAKNESRTLSLSNCTFDVMDAVSLPKEWLEKFKLVLAFDCIHDMAYPQEVLREIHRVMTPNARVMMLEINVHSDPSKNVGNPRAINGYVISLMHCMPVSLHFDNGAGLGTMWGKESAATCLQETGFGEVSCQPSKDRFNTIISGIKKCK